MEQKSLRVLDTNKTFFSKITSTITKMLIPTKLGINNMMISIKRNNLIKTYTNYTIAAEENNIELKDSLLKKYEDAYSLYLEAIDKYIIDSVYKKVKNGTASEFEREALSKYYFVVSLKEKQYIEYKYKKQEYLLKVDYESVINLKKENMIEKYNKFYVQKMDSLYKGLLKNYSVQLADTVSSKLDSVDNIYNKIFTALESYITEILPVKLRTSNKEDYKNITEDYEKYESMLVGKLDERDKIKQKVVLLGLSRELFTHSLPLIAAEQCYERLISEVRNLIMKTKAKPKKDGIYELLCEVIEDYNVRLLSTKVYWDKPEKREEYKKFWNKYKEINSIENKKEKEAKKQILFLKNDYKNLDKNDLFKKELKKKLVELGAIKQIKNSCKTIEGNYKKISK
ncbi:MAG: hypothetical protein J5507_02445 [Clostridia bacterium]|nr:hypothetical protein [Clostridia bacterium]